MHTYNRTRNTHIYNIMDDTPRSTEQWYVVWRVCSYVVFKSIGRNAAVLRLYRRIPKTHKFMFTLKLSIPYEKLFGSFEIFFQTVVLM